MAIYSMHVSNVSRAAGSSSIASCSYITSQRMRDERTGEISYGYGRRERVEHVGTMLPHGAPSEYADPERLFNAIEAVERRVDARPAKKIMVALPREFDEADRIRAVEDFIAVNLTAKGYAATYAIHTDKAGNNPHAHILIANRRIDPKTGKWASKRRTEYALDQNGERIPVIDPATGQQKTGARNRKVWKRVDVSNNPLDSKEFLERLRADWAKQCNLMLPDGVRIDHRSLEAQGINRIPTIHEGYASREITKRGGHSILNAINRRIATANRYLTAIRKQMGDLTGLLQQFKAQAKRELDMAMSRFRESLVFDRQPMPSRGRKTVEAPVSLKSTPGRSLDSKSDPVPQETGREPRRPKPEPVDELAEARRELAELTERWKTEPPREIRDVQRIIDVAREASEKAERANPFTRGRLRHAAERTAAEQSKLLKQTAPWLENTIIPATYAEANAFRANASKATLDHMRKPYEERVRRLSRSRFNERIKQRLAENIEHARTTRELKPQPHRRYNR